jgi:hypothetical protein
VRRGRSAITADYLVVGTGAVGMAFVDEILTGADATVAMVDRREAPGGHWNDAYPFVRLHQPSAYYGVGSRTLGGGHIDTDGPNRGLYERASGEEVRAYFSGLMNERFLPSGRVQVFAGCEHLGEGRLRALSTGEDVQVTARWIVDASWFNTSIPKTHARRFAVEEGVRVIPPNDLPAAGPPAGRHVILGGGKTAMDVVVHLLEQGVPEDRIRWVIPNPMWAINRAFVQPARIHEYQALQMEAAAEAKTADDLFDRLERAGVMLRVHAGVRPTSYRGATVAPGEIDMLGRTTDVVRLGRVVRIRRDGIELEHGTVEGSDQDLFIDCTASAIGSRPPVPVFEGARMTLQMIRPGLICLSAAVIGKVATMGLTEEEANGLCRPVTVDRTVAGFPASLLQGLEAAERWARDRTLRSWMTSHRLTGAGLPGAAPDVVRTMRERSEAAREGAMQNLRRL